MKGKAKNRISPILRGALAVLIVVALAAPLPTGESAAAPLPFCCLVHGEHDCMGQMLGGDPHLPGFSAASRCPYSPLALAAMQGQSLAPPVAGFSLFVAWPLAPLAFRSSSYRACSAITSQSQRGPPASSL